MHLLSWHKSKDPRLHPKTYIQRLLNLVMAVGMMRTCGMRNTLKPNLSPTCKPLDSKQLPEGLSLADLRLSQSLAAIMSGGSCWGSFPCSCLSCRVCSDLLAPGSSCSCVGVEVQPCWVLLQQRLYHGLSAWLAGDTWLLHAQTQSLKSCVEFT